MNKIKQLTLYFPHGASIKACEKLVQSAVGLVGAGVSEGGFATTNHYGLNVENVTFSDDCMHYVYGHKHKSKKEKCNKCGSEQFTVIRDMTSRRQCKNCANTWDCPND